MLISRHTSSCSGSSDPSASVFSLYFSSSSSSSCFSSPDVKTNENENFEYSGLDRTILMRDVFLEIDIWF